MDTRKAVPRAAYSNTLTCLRLGTGTGVWGSLACLFGSAGGLAADMAETGASSAAGARFRHLGVNFVPRHESFVSWFQPDCAALWRWVWECRPVSLWRW